MNFSFDDFNNFSVQHTSHSCRAPAPTNYPQNFHRHGPCSYCSNPYHSSSGCPSSGQLSNFSYEHMNTNFSSLGFDSNSNVYNSNWRNHPDFSWQAQAMRNYAPQYHELHHLEYSQFENQVFHPSPYDSLPQISSLEDTLKECMERLGQSTIQVSQPELSLEDTLNECMERIGQSTIQVPQQESSLEDTFKAFIHLNSQTTQELKNITMIDSLAIQEINDATMANTSAIERLKGQLDRLVVKFNGMDEDELQSQLMADECQILCIWTPRFTLVRPLALLFSNALASFCVFVFCRPIREEWQNFMWKCLEIRKSLKVDRSNSKVDRSNFARSRLIEYNSIDRIFPELTVAEARQNAQSGASPRQKVVLPLIFAAEHAGFVTLVVSSKRGTLEGVREVILHGFLALSSFYKAIAMPPCWREF
jgi:uncharacterized coiled-coil protein SlyX